MKWLFGRQSGIDFSSGIPVAISGATCTDVIAGTFQEGTASIADSAGNLLFYSGGKTVWNRYNNVMPNGSGLMGGVSSTQAALIVPFPGSSRYFYLFTTDEFQSYETSFVAGCRYSVVDMCANDGLGDVDVLRKNILLLDTATEKLAAVRDNSGTGYWVMAHKMFSDAFYAWHITASGISSPVVSHVGMVHGATPSDYHNAQGQMKFSPQGNKVAVTIGNLGAVVVEIFDFDFATGVMSNPVHLDLALTYSYGYGLEFSPDGSKLFVSSSGGMTTNQGIYELDLTAGGGTAAAILASKVQIYNPTSSVCFGLQLGPDNKIYSVIESYYTVGRINNPNLMGSAVGFDSSFLTLTDMNYYTFPSFIAGYNYHNNLVDCNHTGINDATDRSGEIGVYPNPTRDGFTIKYEGEWQARITDMAGRTIKEITGTGTKEFSRENIAPGTYLLTIINAANVKNEKIVFE